MRRIGARRNEGETAEPSRNTVPRWTRPCDRLALPLRAQRRRAARALADTTYHVPQIAPGLSAWLNSACEWEPNRRRGMDRRLRPHEAAIDRPRMYFAGTRVIFEKERADGLLIVPNGVIGIVIDRILKVAAEHRAPTGFANASVLERGGLLSYGPDVSGSPASAS